MPPTRLEGWNINVSALSLDGVSVTLALDFLLLLLDLVLEELFLLIVDGVDISLSFSLLSLVVVGNVTRLRWFWRIKWE